MASIVKNLIEISGLADTLPDNPTTFKQLAIQETLCLPDANPDIEQIVKVAAQVVIISTKVSKTPIATSLEGQKLTGFKLIVEGEIRQNIEYVADDIKQTVHASHFNIPFSTFVVLPVNFNVGTLIIVTPYIEDIFVDMLDNRSVFKNVTLLLDVTF